MSVFFLYFVFAFISRSHSLAQTIIVSHLQCFFHFSFTYIQVLYSHALQIALCVHILRYTYDFFFLPVVTAAAVADVVFTLLFHSVPCALCFFFLCFCFIFAYLEYVYAVCVVN